MTKLADASYATHRIILAKHALIKTKKGILINMKSKKES